MKMADLIHGILFLIGSVLLVLAVYLYLSSRRFLATGIKTQATVVENIPVRYSPKNSSNVRIVSFWGIYLGTNILLILGLPMFMIGSGYFLFKTGII